MASVNPQNTDQLVHVVHLGQVRYDRLMNQTRTLTSSEAKGSLGEVLSSLVSEGPVEITRNGRLVAVISAPPKHKPAYAIDRLAALAALYAAGKVTWRQIADETDASFGDVLLELAKQNLQLPLVSAEKRPEQVRLFNAVLRRAAR